MQKGSTDSKSLLNTNHLAQNLPASEATPENVAAPKSGSHQQNTAATKLVQLATAPQPKVKSDKKLPALSASKADANKQPVSTRALATVVKLEPQDRSMLQVRRSQQHNDYNIAAVDAKAVRHF